MANVNLAILFLNGEYESETVNNSPVVPAIGTQIVTGWGNAKVVDVIYEFNTKLNACESVFVIIKVELIK